MNKPFGSMPAAAVLLPLLAAAVVLPSASDAGLAATSVAAIPLAWAAAVAVAARLDTGGLSAALVAALPFSAFAAAAYGARPAFPGFAAIAACAAAAVAAHGLACRPAARVGAQSPRPAPLPAPGLWKSAAPARGVSLIEAPGRLRLAAAMALGVAPGAAATIVDPLSGMAVSVLVTAAVLYARARRPR